MFKLIYIINWELIVATIAIVISIITMCFQRKHNKLSVTPITAITRGNYKKKVWVKLSNKGTGPLIIKSITAKKGSVTHSNLKDFMPKLPKGIYYVEYIRDFEDRALFPGDSIQMLEFENKDDRYNQSFKEIKEALQGITISIVYENIYGDEKSKTFKPLSFGVITDDKLVS